MVGVHIFFEMSILSFKKFPWLFKIKYIIFAVVGFKIVIANHTQSALMK